MSRWAAAWNATRGGSVSCVSCVTPPPAQFTPPLSLAEIHAEVARWPEALRDEWDERAAIIEFDGGQTREGAEWAAFDCCRVNAERKEIT